VSHSIELKNCLQFCEKDLYLKWKSRKSTKKANQQLATDNMQLVLLPLTLSGFSAAAAAVAK